MEHLNIFKVSNINTTLRFLKTKGFWISAFDSKSNKDFIENKWTGRNVMLFGAEGFGFVPIAEGWFKMEQSGFVSLGNNVEIGCNSAIDRPAVGTTRIENNTKIDNLVHVAHNCNIGESCAFAAQVGLAGGVKVGKRVILAGQVGVANQVSIGDGAIATAQTGIASNINSGEVVSSSPAIDNKLYLKASAIYKRLPEMYKILRNLQKK